MAMRLAATALLYTHQQCRKTRGEQATVQETSTSVPAMVLPSDGIVSFDA